MQAQHEYSIYGSDFPVADLPKLRDGWLLDCRYRQLSANSLEFRKHVLDKLIWWLAREGCEVCGAMEFKAFLTYIPMGHLEPGGRWGNPRMTSPVRPRTVKDYHAHLRIFTRWLVQEDLAPMDLMRSVRPPVARRDSIQPFSTQQVESILAAASVAHHALRDTAIVLFLLDSAVRANELCRLRMRDLDILGRRATVLGKGDWHRSALFGPRTAKAMTRYLRSEPDREPEEAVFMSEQHTFLTPSGLFQIVRRLGQAARVEAVRCSPHTMRHTSAVLFLRSGGNAFALRELLGHNTLSMTSRYVSLAEADVQAQHAMHSPVESLKGRR